MYVFTDEWVQKLEYRYRGHARYEKPNIYFYATFPQYEDLRSEIETWVAQLSESNRAQIIPRLRKEEKFEETYNELVVGHILSKLGFKIEYEKPFYVNGRKYTPDWYTTRDELSLSVEVLTTNPSQPSVQERRKWTYFLARLSEISSNAKLNIIYHRNSAPDQKEVTRLKRQLEIWLARDDVFEGDKIIIHDITFELFGRNSDKHVSLLDPVSVFCVSAQSLKPKIQEKVDKYKSLGLPLVISIVPNFHTYLDLDDIKNLLHGQEAYTFDWDSPNEGQLTRHNDGFYTAPKPVDPSLSTVMWIPKRIGVPLPMPQVGIFPNPNANYPVLPEHFITRP